MDYHARKVNLSNLKFYITLIPKFTGASSPSDYRPIVLEHLLVMLILKVLAIRLQKLMPKANEWVPVCFSQKIEVPRIASYVPKRLLIGVGLILKMLPYQARVQKGI